MPLSQDTLRFIHEHRRDDVRSLALQARRYPSVDMPAAITQISGWQIAKEKIPAWAENEHILYPAHLSLEQCSSQDKITGDNIYKVLVCFEKLYNVMNPLERKKLMEHLISEIQIYPERQPNGQWLKSIKFRLPIVESDIDLCLDNESHTEIVSCYTKTM